MLCYIFHCILYYDIFSPRSVSDKRSGYIGYITAILGIILVVLNIGILLYNFICRMRDKLKDGKFTNEERADAAREMLELAEEIQRLKEELEKKDGNR